MKLLCLIHSSRRGPAASLIAQLMGLKRGEWAEYNIFKHRGRDIPIVYEMDSPEEYAEAGRQLREKANERIR